MKHSYRVELDDGETFEVSSDARDIRRWEATYGKSWLDTPLSYTEVAQLVYLACTRSGVLNGRFPTYDEFDRHCVATAGLPTPPIANPTVPAPTDAPSVPSG